jgi:hypothetical protein
MASALRLAAYQKSGSVFCRLSRLLLERSMWNTCTQPRQGTHVGGDPTGIAVTAGHNQVASSRLVACEVRHTQAYFTLVGHTSRCQQTAASCWTHTGVGQPW